MQIAGKLGALWRRRRGGAAASAVIAAFFALMFAPEIFGGKYVLAGDPLYYTYPLRSVGWEMMRGGQLPLWTPLVLSGYPLLSMSQLAFAYPLTWGYLFLPGHWAEQAYVLAPFLLSPLFTYAYAREVGRSRTAAVLAGLSFGYGGMMCSAIVFNGALTNSLMWLPLLLIPIDRAARRAGRFVPLLIAATAAYAMSVLNGHGQSMLYTGLLAAAYGLYLSFFPPADDNGSGDATGETSRTDVRGDDAAAAEVSGWSRWRPLWVALGALVMSAGLGAFQILETMRAARRSVRSVLTYEAFSTGSFSFTSALGSVVAPLYHFTDVTAYMPPLALLLAALICVVSVRRRRRAGETTDTRIYFWLGVAAVAWLLMLGSNTPLHRVVYHVPLLNKFRVPSRHTFEWTFALAVLAAYGWDALDAWLGASRRRLSGRRLTVESAVIVLLIAGGVATGFYWWTAAQAKPQAGTVAYTSLPESAYLLWKATFAACTLLLLWRSSRLAAGRVREGLLMAAIALVCFVEPAIGFSRWIGDLLLTAERFSVVSPTTRLLQNLPPEQNRVYTRVQLYTEEFTHAPRLDATNLSALRGIQNVAGYEPLLLERYSRALGGVGMDAVTPRAGYMRNSDLFQSRSRVLDLLNTTHVVSFSGLAPIEETLVVKEGIAFAQTDALSALPPGGSLMLTGGAEESDSLALVTSLSNSVDVPQGTPVARVRFHLSGALGSAVIERDVRAGIDTAEWAHERPDVRPVIEHALAPIFEARPGDEGDSFKAYRYLARLPLGTRGRIDKIEITNLTERAYLALSKATLYDSAGKSTATPLSPAASEDWETVYLKDNTLILKNRRALPRAWLVTAAEAVDGEEALRRIRGESAREFDPRRTALLEVAPAELPALKGGELGEGSGARIASYEPNRLVIETQAAEPTVLVVSENIYPGWEATVNGRAARIDTANYLLRGIALPPGAHRVEMRYTAPAARNGAIISAVTLLLLSSLAFYDRRARQRQPTTGTTRLEKYLSRFGESLKRHTASLTGTLDANGSLLRRPLQAVARRPLLREVLIFLGFVALAALMTWPWLRHPLDTVSDLGDPYTIAYTLWWDYHQTFRDPRHLFDATIFYPYRDTLAFTEHDYGIALLFFPLFALGVQPLTVHSLATFLAFVFSGYGAFRLARTLTASYGAAWVAGIAFAFIPYRFQRVPHLHYIFAGWIPLLLEALILFARERSWRRASWLGVAFLMNALTCITWFILSLIPLGLSAALLALRYGAWRDRAWWLRGAASLAAASLVLLPFLLPYRRVAALHQFTRGTYEVNFYSATALNWLAASPRLKLWQGLGGISATEELSLFPGLLLPLLAFAGLVLFNTRTERKSDEQKRDEQNGDAQKNVAQKEDGQKSDAQKRDGHNDDGQKDDERSHQPDGLSARWKRFASPSRLALLLLDAFVIGAGIIAVLISGYGTINFGLFGLHLFTATRPEAAFTACLVAAVARAAITFGPLLLLRRRAGAKNFGGGDDTGRSVETFAHGAIWLVVGFVGSLGMHTFFYRFLYEHFEVFKSQRIPARWAMISYLGLALLAGLGARALAKRFAAPHRPLLGAGVYALVIILLLFDLRVAPLVVKRGDAYPDELTLRLKETPMRGGLAELPVTGWATFSYMIRAADHEKPIITATSSFLPSITRRIESLSQQRPVPMELLDLLESVPASYLVIHHVYLMTPEDVAAIHPLLRQGLETGRLRFIRSYHDRGRKDLYAITKTEPAAAGEAPAPPELVAPVAAAAAAVEGENAK